MGEIDLLDFLENYKLPRFSPLEPDPKFNIWESLKSYGSYCRRKRIKYKDTSNRYSPNIHFISENFGKKVRVEMRYENLIAVISQVYDKPLQNYVAASTEHYDLFFREDKQQSYNKKMKTEAESYLEFIDSIAGNNRDKRFLLEINPANASCGGKKSITFSRIIEYRNPKFNEMLPCFCFFPDKLDSKATEKIEGGLVSLVKEKGYKIDYFNSIGVRG